MILPKGSEQCCDFDPYEDEESRGDESWHFKLTCLHCGFVWWGLHCPHDGRQNPCPKCGIHPTPIPVEE